MRNARAGLVEGLARLAAGQHGLITHAQACAAGLSRTAIMRRVRAGTWQLMRPRVFRPKDARESLEQRMLAACLWLGEGAVVSHRSAALLHGLRVDGWGGERVEVTIGRGAFREAEGIVIHRAACAAAPEDRRVRHGVPVTSVARTLVDLATCLDEEPLAYLLDEAWRRQLAAPDWVERRLRQLGGNGRRGAGTLAKLLADCRRRGAPLESALEVRLWRLLRRSRMPLPEPGYEFRDDYGPPGRIDFAYADQHLAVEADSFEFHGDRAAFERDRVRVCRLAALGWRVMPVTWRQLDEQPKKVLGRIREALEARAGGLGGEAPF